MAKKTTKTEENIQAVEEALSRTEHFIETNQKPILIILGIIVVVILGYFGFQKLYIVPKEKSAQEQMFMAEAYFGMDSLDLALNGDGFYPGFLEIIDNYKLTKSANLAKYYTGLIYLNKGDYEIAIEYLKDFDSDDLIIMPMALGAIGDAFMELDMKEDAVDYYLDAANNNENDFTTPQFLLKAAWTYEILGDYEKAVVIYKQIKTEFPRSRQARDIDKYIARANGYLGK